MFVGVLASPMVYQQRSRSSRSRMFFKVGVPGTRPAALRPAILLKRDSNLSVFLWILQNFQGYFFLQNHWWLHLDFWLLIEYSDSKEANKNKLLKPIDEDIRTIRGIHSNLLMKMRKGLHPFWYIYW